MKTICTFLIVAFSLAGMYGQTTAWSKFTPQFRNDSLGNNGFRNSAVVYDSTKTTALVNGVSMVGWTQARVEKYLGKSNSTSVNGNTVTLEYTIYNNVWTDGGILVKYVSFSIVNGVVTSAYLKAAH